MIFWCNGSDLLVMHISTLLILTHFVTKEFLHPAHFQAGMAKKVRSGLLLLHSRSRSRSRSRSLVLMMQSKEIKSKISHAHSLVHALVSLLSHLLSFFAHLLSFFAHLLSFSLISCRFRRSPPTLHSTQGAGADGQ